MLVTVRNLPDHVAIIMDGNGRWAEQLGRPRQDGHREGSRAVRRIVRACRRLGVSALTVYAFSEQNWERPQEEVDALMGLLREFLVSERSEILDHAIRLRAVGSLDRLPEAVRTVLDPLAQRSSENQGMTLTLALSYGGREEILDAARDLSRAVQSGQADADATDLDAFAARMPSMQVGPVDLLIRTGGEQRISNFLLWGAAYAELFFSDKLWPDYDEVDLYQAIAAYQKRERRFGLVSEQLALGDADADTPHIQA